MNNAALLQQQTIPYYFHFPVALRFADLNCGRSLHPSKALELFEMARFDILRRLCESQSQAQISTEALLFLVVRADLTRHGAWRGQQEALVRTRLLVQTTPVMEFHQLLLSADGSEPVYSAILRVAAVEQDLKPVPDWAQSIAPLMAKFVIEHGQKETNE